MDTSGLARPVIPTGRKLVYGLGDHTVSVVLSTLSLVFFFYLTAIVGLEPWRAGAVVWMARVVDAVSDPLMGRISDHTHTRFGRRRPWFLVGALPFGVSYALLWQIPEMSQNGMMLYALVVYIALSLSMTVLSVPYLALIPEWARDFDERTTMNTVRSTFAVLGTMVAAALPWFAAQLGDDRDAYATLGSFVGVWLVLPWLAVFFVSQEPTDRPPPTRAPPLLESLRSLGRHRTYLRLCALFVSARIATDLLGLAVPLYMTEWLLRRSDISPMLLSMLSVVVFSLPVWLAISRKRDKHTLFAFGAGWFAIMLLGLALIGPESPRFAMFVIAGLIGIGYAVADLMPWAMLGEVIDEDELLTGERREGLYNGVFTFLRKAGGASAYGLAGFALSFVGYDAAVGASEDVRFVILSITAFIPGVFLVIALVLALGYPLSRARHAEIKAALAARAEAIHAGAPPL